MTTQEQGQETASDEKKYFHNAEHPEWNTEAQRAGWIMTMIGDDLLVKVPSCPRCEHPFEHRIPGLFTTRLRAATTITVHCQCRVEHEGAAPSGSTKHGCGAVFSGVPVQLPSPVKTPPVTVTPPGGQ